MRSHVSKAKRREALMYGGTALAAVVAAVCVVPLAGATTPIPTPATLEQQIRYWGNYVYVGTLRRVLYITHERQAQLLSPGEPINFNALPFVAERSDKRPGGTGWGFFEIVDARPVMVRKAVSGARLPKGRIFQMLRDPDFLKSDSPYQQGMGKEMIFVFSAVARTIGQRELLIESPLMEVDGRTTLDNSPFPIALLPEAKKIASAFDYIEV